MYVILSTAMLAAKWFLRLTLHAVQGTPGTNGLNGLDGGSHIHYATRNWTVYLIFTVQYTHGAVRGNRPKCILISSISRNHLIAFGISLRAQLAPDSCIELLHAPCLKALSSCVGPTGATGFSGTNSITGALPLRDL